MHRSSLSCIQAPAPGWLRLPDAVAYSGIGKRTLYKAITEGQVKSVCVRQNGRAKGIRLVNLQSLESWISSFNGV
jgi:hypothetical protein